MAMGMEEAAAKTSVLSTEGRREFLALERGIVVCRQRWDRGRRCR